jgi:tetratricopeptide (TPR) repeat protein
MNVLGSGLASADRDEDALVVKEAELSMLRRIGACEEDLLVVQGNIATTYRALGRLEEALSLRQDVYSATLKLLGGDNIDTLLEANNYGNCLRQLKRFEEARLLLRKNIPVAQRVLGAGNEQTLRLRWNYARALYEDDGATLDNLREAVTRLEDTARIAKRVLGGAHPLTVNIEDELQEARAVLRARETPPSGGPEVLQTADDLAAYFGGS